MNLTTENYAAQRARWPEEGRHILAHFDDETLIVYQAYRPAIGRFALEHGRFGGEFSFSRMSWIKPNFLWMMYRSGWGRKEGQEVILGLRLRRTFFESILSPAVASNFDQAAFAEHDRWRAALAGSEVRLQWDPDHDPDGRPLPRRAIQLGLRGSILRTFGGEELLEVIDMSDFVRRQRETLAQDGPAALELPQENVFVPSDPAISDLLKLD